MKYKKRLHNKTRQDENIFIHNQIVWQENKEKKFFEDEQIFLEEEQRQIKRKEMGYEQNKENRQAS